MKDEYTLGKLFNDYRGGIRIPYIQREYAQGRQDERGEIIRRTFVPELVRAVFGRKPLSLDFIYGVSDETSAILPLDGQQRLTTLFLLAWCCGKWHGDWRFSYESRRIPELFVHGLIAHPRQPRAEAVAQIREAEWFLPVWEKDTFEFYTDAQHAVRVSCPTCYHVYVNGVEIPIKYSYKNNI